ncbi:MAG: autotransporter domain-containing protein [Hyphomicrobiaceae bacterium]
MNTATADSDQTDPQSAQASVTIAPQTPAISLDKAFKEVVDKGAPGISELDEVKFEITVTNTGTVTLYDVQVTEQPDTSLDSCAPAVTTLAPGEQIVCQATHALTDGEAVAGNFTNTATVDALGPNEQEVSDDGSATFEFEAAPTDGSITIRKVAVNGDGKTSFDFNGANGFQNIKPPADGTATRTQTFTNLPLNGQDIVLTEEARTGWSVTGISCNRGAQVQTDLVNRQVQIHLSRSEDVVCTFTNELKKGTSGVNIVVNATDRDGEFPFVTGLPGGSSFNVATVGGSKTRGFLNIAKGTYNIQVPELRPGWRLTGVNCADPSGDSTTDLAALKAKVPLAAGELVTCTFDFFFDEQIIKDRTHEVILNFMKHRAEGLIDEGPDRARINRRLPGTLWGDEAGGATATGFAQTPFNFTAVGDEQDYTLEFSTSLSQMLQYNEGQNQKKLMGLTQAPDTGLGVANPVLGAIDNPASATFLNHPSRQGFDAWVEGHYRHFEDHAGSADTFGHFGVVYLGGDYLVTDAILVGALVQFDWAEERSRITGSNVSGTGWMAGPYASIRLTPNVFLDGRIAWGQSDNTVDPFGGFYEDNFKTDRWLANINLKGNWVYNSIRITPGVSYTYFNENQKAYVDSNAVLIEGQTLTVNRLEFGPEFGYRFVNAEGDTFEPHIAIKGLWDIGGNLDTTVNGIEAGRNELRGKIEGGFLAQSAYGPSVRLTFSYDGIGDDDFTAYGGQMWLNVPLD